MNLFKLVPSTLALALSLALGLCFASCETVPGASDYRRITRAETGSLPDPGYDVEHYSIDVVLFPERRTIEGECTIRFVPTRAALRELAFDLSGLEVTSVRSRDGASLDFAADGEKLHVRYASPLAAGELAELTVLYGGKPTTGLWFSGTRPDGSGPTQVFTQGQPEHSRGWFPCFDHPSDRATSEVRVTMPSHWISVAPGERIDATENGGSRTDHWRMSTPHPSYLVSLVAGEFITVDSEWEGVPLQFIVERKYEDWVEASFHETDEILSFLSTYTGIRYPYSKYSQACVANFPWGGMENISATTLTPLTLGDERSQRDRESTGLVAHEAAHQWFGNLFTCADWSHIWLNEGFATYMTLLYFEETRGLDEFRILMRDCQEENIEEDSGTSRRPTVSSTWKDPEDLMDTRAYQGGAARLHLLRFLLGDDVFRSGVRTFASENTGQSVVTADLQRAMEKVSGRDLNVFFGQWIYGAGYPEFELEWDWNEIEDTVSLSVRQQQTVVSGTPAVFRVPVDIEIVDAGGTVRHRIELTRRSETFKFAADSRPLYVNFDKYGWIPKVVRWTRPQSEWLAIANEDDDVNARRDAVREMGALAASMRERGVSLEKSETLVTALVGRLKRDTSSHVRAAAATALGRALGLEARERLQFAVDNDPEARVRVAALSALASFGPSPELATFARRTFEAGYSWATMGAAARLVCSADPQRAYAWVTEKLFMESPHDVMRGFLLESLGALKNRGVSEQLRRWAADESVHPNARAVAVRQLGIRRPEAIENSRFMTKLLTVENFRLRRAAVEALAALADDNARRSLKAYYPKARTSSERRVIEAALVGGAY